MFLGTYSLRLDEKNRLLLPAKFREQLAEGLVIAQGQEHCLYLFSNPEFHSIYERIRQAPLTSKQVRDYARVFLSGASAETPDKQNRIILPARLRAYAGLNRELTVIGVGDHLEIWDAPTWERYLVSQEENFSQIAEEVVPGLL